MDFDYIKQNIGDFKLTNTSWYDVVDSTNDRLKSETVGSLCIADVQTFGKGTRGRSFVSREGGLYFSFVAEAWGEKTGLMTPAAAVAVSQTLREETGLQTKIKWVNDIYVGNKKLCGILAERTAFGVVVGIGINLTNSLPKSLSSIATSVKAEGGVQVDRERLVAGILKRFAEFEKDEKFSFMIEYKRDNFVLGRQIEYVQNGLSHVGIATDMLPDGRLVVDGSVVLSSGDVSLKLK